LTKKLSTFKVASAAFAGLLTLSSGLAVAGASLSDGSTTDPAQVTATETDGSLIAEPGTEIEDGDAGDVVVDKGDAAGDDADGDDKAVEGDGTEGGEDAPKVEEGDGGTVIVTIGDTSDDAGDDQEDVEEPARPENHGSMVSAVARDNEARGADDGNHGAAVSAAARSGKPAHDGDDATPPADDHGSPTIGDDDDDQDEVEVDDDDQGGDDGDQGDDAGEHRRDGGRHDEEDEG
jgi:hypothetical protein